MERMRAPLLSWSCGASGSSSTPSAGGGRAARILPARRARADRSRPRRIASTARPGSTTPASWPPRRPPTARSPRRCGGRRARRRRGGRACAAPRACSGSCRAGAGTTWRGSSGSRPSPRPPSTCSPTASRAPLDLAEVDGRVFCGIAIVRLRLRRQPDRQRDDAAPGQLVYLYAALRALAGWRPRASSSCSTASPRRSPAGRWRWRTRRPTAAGCSSPPAPRSTTGCLDVVTHRRDLARAASCAALPKVFKGDHVEQARGHACAARARSASTPTGPSTVYADGDPVGRPARHGPRAARRRPRPAARGQLGAVSGSREGRRRAGGRRASRAQPGAAATSLPGKLLMRMEPGAIGALAAPAAAGQRGDLGDERQDHDGGDGRGDPRAPTARASCTTAPGANMAGGVASTLLGAARRDGIDGDARALRGRRVLARQRRRRAASRARCCWPTCSATSSTATASSTRSPTAGPRSSPPRRRAAFVLNADDPTVADLGRERARRDLLRRRGPLGVALAEHAARLGRQALPPLRRTPTSTTPPTWATSATTAAPTAARARPHAAASPPSDVVLDGTRGARFTLRTPAGTALVALPLPGLYNVYNALGAAALALALGVALRRRSSPAWRRSPPAFGRAETVLDRRARARDPARQEPGRGQRGAAHARARGRRARRARRAQRQHRRRARRLLGLGRRLRGPRRPRAAGHVRGHARGGARAAPEVRGRAARTRLARRARRSSAALDAALADGAGPLVRPAHLHRDARAAARCSSRAAHAGRVARQHDRASSHVVWHDVECGAYDADLPLWRELAAAAAGPGARRRRGHRPRRRSTSRAAGDEVDRARPSTPSCSPRCASGPAASRVETVVADARELRRSAARLRARPRARCRPSSCSAAAAGRAALPALRAARTSRPAGVVAVALADALEALRRAARPAARCPTSAEHDGACATSPARRACATSGGALGDRAHAPEPSTAAAR